MANYKFMKGNICSGIRTLRNGAVGLTMLAVAGLSSSYSQAGNDYDWGGVILEYSVSQIVECRLLLNGLESMVSEWEDRGKDISMAKIVASEVATECNRRIADYEGIKSFMEYLKNYKKE